MAFNPALFANASPLGQLSLADLLQSDSQGAPPIPQDMSPRPLGQDMPAQPPQQSGLWGRLKAGLGGLNQGLTDRLFQPDPLMTEGLSPAQLQAMKNSARTKMALGLLGGMGSGNNFFQNFAGAAGGAQQSFQGSLGNVLALRHQMQQLNAPVKLGKDETLLDPHTLKPVAQGQQSTDAPIAVAMPDGTTKYVTREQALGQAPASEDKPLSPLAQLETDFKSGRIDKPSYLAARTKLLKDGSEERKPQLVDVPMPDGTTQKQWIVPGQTAGTNVGSPTNPTGFGAGRIQQMVGRITLAGNEATQAAENIMKMGIGANKGWLGINNAPAHGVLNAVKSSLTNAISSEDTKSYGIFVSGVKRNLAAIEAAGNMPPGSLTNQMDQVELKPGDTQFNKLQRMAEIRQIADAGLDSITTMPGLGQKQIDQIQGIRARMQKAIPFSQADLLNLQQSRNPHATITDFARDQGVGGTLGAPQMPAAQAPGGWSIQPVQ